VIHCTAVSWRWSCLALLALVASVSCEGGRSAGERGDSVLLVTIDTLRADRLSRAGYERATSPAIDAFTRRGTFFERAFSTTSYTVPAHASMLVGRYPSFHSAGLMNGHQRFLETEETLAERLREAGWRTAAVVSNAMLAAGVGLAQGFEVYDDALPDREAVRGYPERNARSAVDRSLELLDGFGHERFLLWLHLQDPHGPYAPPEPTPGLDAPDESGRVLPVGEDNSGFGAIPRYQLYRGEQRFASYGDRYDREIRFLDRQLGRLFAALDERGLDERVLVILTADHGEALGEDGFFFSHSHSVGLDQVRVPRAFVGPGVRAGASIPEPVTNLDVFATVLDYLGRPVPNDVQSRSLLPALTSGAAVPAGPFFTESLTQRGVVHEGLYLRSDRRPPSDEAFWARSPLTAGAHVPLGTELVRLDGGDPAGEPPRDLEGALEGFSARAERAVERFEQIARSIPADRARMERLRALGYAR